MIGSRRTFFAWMVAALSGDLFRELLAQDQPPKASRSEAPQVLGYLRFGGPYQQIEVAASAMRPGDLDSIRAVVEEIVNYTRYYRMPDVMTAIVKQRANRRAKGLLRRQKRWSGGRCHSRCDQRAGNCV